jgi:regulator of extracellular matrix RemA (YlzA/DUF370 family)
VYIHIGSKSIVSDKKIIGIFNAETLKKSDLNIKIMDKIDFSQRDIKTIVIDSNNDLQVSKVSSFTIIKRTSIDDKDCVWRVK